MHLPPLAVLVAWIPLGVWLFRRFPVRIAILVNFLGGWALLPGANYTPTPDDFPYWILGVCLPAGYLLTKATVIGFAALAGILAFHSADWKNFRPSFYDAPMALWCCVPLLSALTHWNTFSRGFTGAIYQSIAWGIPWFLGRRYFSGPGSLLLAAKACVIAATCYVPICLLEIVTGPHLYEFFYGYQPYQWVGAQRYIGHRPIGFLEDGNQLGIWMAASTLLAVTLVLRKLTLRILGLPAAWVAAALAVVTLLCQSAGSIVLLLALLPLTFLKSRSILRASLVVLVLGIVFFALFRMTGLVSLRALAQSNGFLRSIAEHLNDIGRHSLVWRLGRDESHMRVALRHPLLGWGQWDWWRSGDTRPWGLWLLVFGMYGLVGLAALGAIFFLPILRIGWPKERTGNANEFALGMAVVGLTLMVAFDSLLNSTLILPYLLLIGGLATRNPNSNADIRNLNARITPPLRGR